MARTTERKKRGGRPEEGRTPAAKDIVVKYRTLHGFDAR